MTAFVAPPEIPGQVTASQITSLRREIARLQDLVAKFQRGEPSDKFEKHGA